MSRFIQSSALPAVMETKLRAIRRRRAALAVARAVLIGAATLLAAMLLAMLTDWTLMLFSTTVRIALSLTALAAAATALVASAVRPLADALGWTRAAASADQAAPQLEERWTTVASFAVSEHQPASPVAQAMLQQVKSEAAAMGPLVEPRRAAGPVPLRPALLAMSGCALVLAGFMGLGWPQTSVLWRRFWSPWANITATQLRSLTGDVAIPRGETLDLRTEIAGLARHAATLTIEHESGVADVFALEPDAARPQLFVHSLRVEDSFRYQVRAGDGQTKWGRVTAIDYPELAEVRFSVTAPVYVNRPRLEKTLIPRRVKVVQGSRLELLMKPLAPVERLELTLNSAPAGEETIGQVVALAPDAAGWYRFETQLLQDFSFAPTLVNAHGLTNEDKPMCNIQVIPDKAPVARIVSPTEEMSVAADEAIEIKFEAHDDQGVATAELVVYDESGAEEGAAPMIVSVQEIPLGDQQFAKYVTASTRLDLKELNLAPGANISYAVRVTDNRQMSIDPDPKSALSELEGMLAAADPRPRSAGGEGETNSNTAQQQATNEGAFQEAPAPGETATSQTPEKASAAIDRPQGKSESGGAIDVQPAAATSDASPGEPRGFSAPENPASENPASDDPGAKKPGADSSPEQNSSGGNPANRETEKPNSQDETPASSDAGDPTTQEAPTKNSPSDASPKPGAQNADAQNPDAQNPGAEDPDGDPKPTDNAPAAQPRENDGEPAAAPIPEDAEAIAGRQEADKPSEAEKIEQQQAANSTNAGGSGSNSGSPPPSKSLAMSPQQSTSGQNTETSRRRLKITERLTAVAADDPENRTAESMAIRDRVVQIDNMLAAIEADLTRTAAREIPDSDRGEQFGILDEKLGDVEEYIARLHDETKDDSLAFVGLQMVDIGRSHVTPARDRVFLAARDLSAAEAHAGDALQHVVRARELLAALLERYDRVVRERELADALEESVKMYEVYVEKMQQLMREARQNTNPLDRKMEIIEVDQEYLDRFAEVLTLRREMLSEFGRMLADDPRLLARYLDLIKRRRTSLRDQLSELAQRQDEIATELSGWAQVDDAQREDLWTLLADLRLQATTDLAKDAAELAERVEKQMPLVLEPSLGTAAAVIGHAQEIARTARAISFEAPKHFLSRETTDSSLTDPAEQLVARFRRLEAALDQMNFEHEDEEEVAGYVTARLLESRTVADQAEAWRRVARRLQEKRYAGLAEVDQQDLSIATELLRVEMLGLQADLDAQFQQQTESGAPAEILDLVNELHRVMEGVVLNQAAAVFAATRDNLDEAEAQQAKALAGFQRAEELFDNIRRQVVQALDEYDPPDPNIADLVDPTLDEFLRQLEREPNIEAQLGIPNRPRNLRVIAESLQWQQDGAGMLGESGEAAAQRARETIKTARKTEGEKAPPKREPTDQERRRIEKEKEMQDVLAKSLASLEEKIKDPAASPQERRKLEQMAENLRRMLEQIEQQTSNPQVWEEMAEADQAKEVLEALARGEAIPDQQWNKLLSTLEDGLWQVRGKTPPADFRKAIEQYQDRIRQLMNNEG